MSRSPAKAFCSPAKSDCSPANPFCRPSSPLRRPAQPPRRPAEHRRRPAERRRCRPAEHRRRPATTRGSPAKPLRSPAKPLRSPAKPLRSPAKCFCRAAKSSCRTANHPGNAHSLCNRPARPPRGPLGKASSPSFPSFPNSVWERPNRRNSVSLIQGKGPPKQSFGELSRSQTEFGNEGRKFHFRRGLSPKLKFVLSGRGAFAGREQDEVELRESVGSEVELRNERERGGGRNPARNSSANDASSRTFRHRPLRLFLDLRDPPRDLRGIHAHLFENRGVFHPSVG